MHVFANFNIILYFNSHAHVERDCIKSSGRHFTRNFNSHAHVERDIFDGKEWNTEKNFNSHAHVERDRDFLRYAIGKIISTHTLTWSVTFVAGIRVHTHFISTHTLTWSVTWGLMNTDTYYDFNSHAHVERDRTWEDFDFTLNISTHTLTWSVTVSGVTAAREDLFQLTRSRGA